MQAHNTDISDSNVRMQCKLGTDYLQETEDGTIQAHVKSERRGRGGGGVRAAHLHPLIEPEHLGGILVSLLLQNLFRLRLVSGQQAFPRGCSLQQGCREDLGKGSIIVVTQQPQGLAHMLLHVQQNSSTAACKCMMTWNEQCPVHCQSKS